MGYFILNSVKKHSFPQNTLCFPYLLAVFWCVCWCLVREGAVRGLCHMTQAVCRTWSLGVKWSRQRMCVDLTDKISACKQTVAECQVQSGNIWSPWLLTLAYASLTFLKIPERYPWKQSTGRVLGAQTDTSKSANIFACQSHFQSFPNDIINQNSMDSWSSILEAFGCPIGYPRIFVKFRNKSSSAWPGTGWCPAHHWQVILQAS